LLTRCARPREGTDRRFALLSASISALEITAGSGLGVDAILGELSRVKTAAKARSGNSCLILNEAGLHDLLSQGAAPDGASSSLRRLAG
jgi:hypothetical protein